MEIKHDRMIGKSQEIQLTDPLNEMMLVTKVIHGRAVCNSLLILVLRWD